MKIRRITQLCLGALLISSAASSYAGTSLTATQILSETQIHKAEMAAINLAHKLGRAGSFILVDTHGEIIAAYRMPGALPSTFNFAKAKAETAVALGTSTEHLATAVPQPILNNLLSNQGGKYVIFPGGYPVRVGHKLIAGIAFGSTIVALDSNVANPDTPHKNGDILCAKAALAALTDTTDNKKASV